MYNQRAALDSAAGQFSESPIEAVERPNKDKDAFSIFVAAGTTSGDRDIRESHTKVGQISLSAGALSQTSVWMER